jgi:hypothetical protein
MSEFVNRVSAQRKALEAVNSARWAEPLFGLSSGALERWCASNALTRDATIVQYLYLVSEKLAFLANQSQEQISEEYAAASVQISELTARIETIVRQEGLANARFPTSRTLEATEVSGRSVSPTEEPHT